MASLGELAVIITAKTAGLIRGINTVNRHIKKFSRQAVSGLKLFHASIKKAGQLMRKMSLYAAGLIAVVYKIGKAFADFEQNMANVSTMLDDHTMHYIPEYKNQVRALSVEIGESTATLSKGLYDILSASVDAGKAMDVLKVSSIAAKAGLTDTGTAADAITTVMKSYQVSADRAGEISDKLFAIVKRGKLTFGDLAPNIGKVASLSAQAGLSFDELGASIATLTRAGIKTEEAMTAINGVLRVFLKPEQDAINVAKQFGLELNTTTLRTEGLIGVMKKLSQASTEQLAAISPNIRGLRGYAGIITQVEDYEKDLTLMHHSVGLANKAFQKNTDTLAHSWSKAKQSFINAAVSMGERLAPTLETLAGKIQDAGKFMADWLDRNKELVESKIAEYAKMFAEKMKDLAEQIWANRDSIIELGKNFVALIKVIAQGVGLLGKFANAIMKVFNTANEAARKATKSEKEYMDKTEEVFNRYAKLATDKAKLQETLEKRAKILHDIQLAEEKRVAEVALAKEAKKGVFVVGAMGGGYVADEEALKKHRNNAAQATEEILRLKAEYESLTAATVDEIEKIIQKQYNWDDSTKKVKRTFQDVFNDIVKQFNSLSQKVSQNKVFRFITGADKYKPIVLPPRDTKNVIDDNKDTADDVKNVWKDTATTIAQDMGNAFLDMTNGANRFKDTITELGTSILKTIAQVAMMQAIGGFGDAGQAGTGILGLFGGGKSKGGLIRPVYAQAGFMAKGTDTVPAMLTPGEMVLPRNMTNWIKGQLRMPKSREYQQTSGGQPVQITIQAIDSQDVNRFLSNNKRKIADIVAGTTRDNHPNRKTR